MRILLVIIAISAALYAPVLGLGFVSDDNGLITHPIAGIANQSLSTIFTSDLWHFQESQSGYYRPLMMCSLLLDHTVFGDWAVGYHLQSLLWHLLCVGLIGLLFGRLMGSIRGSIAAGLYAFHPLVSEQVAFISARNDSMALAFALAAVWFAGPKKANPKRCMLACLLAAAACLSKETGVVVLCLLPLIDWARHQPFAGWHRYAALIAGVTGAYFVREMLGPGILHTPAMPGSELVASERMDILAHLLGKLTWPFPLTDSTHIAYLDTLRLTPAIAALFLMVYLTLGGDRWAKVGITFALVTLIPGLLAIASRFLIGERYLTLAVLGMAVAIAAIIPKHPKSPWLLVLTLPWLVGTHDRITDWSSDLTLATSAHEAAPTPYTAAWLGHEMAKSGQLEKALPYFDEATRGTPPTCDFAGEWIRVARDANGSTAALDVANTVWERRCANGPGVRGEWALTHLKAGDVESAQKILSPRPTHCTPSLALPVIALSMLEGALEQAKHCAKTSGVPSSVLKPQVDSLLGGLVNDRNAVTTEDENPSPE